MTLWRRQVGGDEEADGVGVAGERDSVLTKLPNIVGARSKDGGLSHSPFPFN